MGFLQLVLGGFSKACNDKGLSINFERLSKNVAANGRSGSLMVGYVEARPHLRIARLLSV